jgi:hypothetical protein
MKFWQQMELLNLRFVTPKVMVGWNEDSAIECDWYYECVLCKGRSLVHDPHAVIQHNNRCPVVVAQSKEEYFV